MDTPLLLSVAIIPSLLLLAYIYYKDPIEKEPMGLLISLLVLGAVSTIPAYVLEKLGFWALGPTENVVTMFVGNFLIVALVEEGCKFLFLWVRTWKSKEFNYLFDGIVYAVFVSLGFAIVEDVLYAFEYGMSISVMRACMSLVGHPVFAVYMGYFYGLAKRAECDGNVVDHCKYLFLSLVAPLAAHGAYDFLIDASSYVGPLPFFGVVFILFMEAKGLVKRLAHEAQPIASAPEDEPVTEDVAAEPAAVDEVLAEEPATVDVPADESDADAD